MEELSHVLTKDFISCVHVRFYFFTVAHFHLAANISHFLTAAMKFLCFSSNEIRLPSSFSVILMSVNIKNNVERRDFVVVVVFLSPKVRADMRFSSVAFGLIELHCIGVTVVRRTVGHLGSVQSRDYQIF